MRKKGARRALFLFLPEKNGSFPPTGKEPRGLFARENGMTAWGSPMPNTVYHNGGAKTVELR